MRNLLLLIAVVLAAPLSASPLPEKADLLAQNTVVARYIGSQHRPCMFRTAECPDRCGHATTVAVFEVLSNEQYSKPGQYGDDKAEPGSRLMLDVQRDIPGQPEAVRETLQQLTPGEKLRLTVSHYYVNVDNSHFPVRPVTQLEKLAPAAEDDAPLPPLPEVEEPQVMPCAR